MFATRSTKEVLSPTQKVQLEEQIHAFNNAYQKLWEMDQKVLIPVVMGAAVWLRSNLGLIESTITAGAGIYFLDFSFKERALRSNKFIQELKQLAALYQSASASGCDVTHEDVYLRALALLAPLIASTSDLLPNGFFDRPQDVSDKYFDILFRSPHRLPPPNMAATPATSYVQRFLSMFGGKRESSASLENKFFPAASKQNIVSSTISNATHYIYGYQSVDQLMQASVSSTWKSLRENAEQLIMQKVEDVSFKPKSY